jgi:hypothetical protein
MIDEATQTSDVEQQQQQEQQQQEQQADEPAQTRRYHREFYRDPRYWFWPTNARERERPPRQGQVVLVQYAEDGDASLAGSRRSINTYHYIIVISFVFFSFWLLLLGNWYWY